MAVLYVFNPEHDLALGNGSPYFNAPSAAKQFAMDCRMLPSMVFGTDRDIYCSADMLKGVDMSVVEAVEPWGWDYAVANSLLKAGLDTKLLPDNSWLDKIRNLSNRKVAIDALEYMKRNQRLDIPVPRMLTAVDEAKALMDEYGSVVYKMPWSGSGKGIRVCNGGLTDNDVRWLNNVINKQSAVVGERYNTVVVDFAMEFYVGDGVKFEGYSLFEVNGGSYKNSVLMSDDAIENYLKQWVSIDELRLSRDNITTYMLQLLGDGYKGCFGVDMYVYADGSGYKLNPMVEINMRMTMGYVANAVRRKLMATDRQKMYVSYDAHVGNILLHHQEMLEKYPLMHTSDGKILSGYMSLTPPTERSKYNIYVL